MQIILSLPAKALAAQRNTDELIDCIRVLHDTCSCDIVVSKAGLGGLVEEWLEEHGIPYKITRSEIEVWHGEFEIVDANEKVDGARFPVKSVRLKD